MKRFSIVLTASIVILAALAPVLAAESNREARDKEDLRKLVATYVEAFNKGDTETIAGLWAPQADSIGPKGKLIKGREAIKKNYAAFFAANPNVQLKTHITSLRLISDNVAILDTAPEVIPPLQGPPVEIRATLVIVKRGDKWLVESARDVLHYPPSNYDHLKQLEWLLGDWKDFEGDAKGVSVESTADWTVNKNFIIRKFTVTIADRISAGGTQVIGWDPRANTIRSWVFDSSGEFSHADWKRDGNHRWIIRSVGVLRDGSEVSSINIVTRLDNDTFTFESRNRTTDGEPQPDIEPVTIKRLAAQSDGSAEPPRETILPE